MERAYGLETSHTLAQQVAYQTQLGALEATALDIKAREAAEEAKASRVLADKANSQLSSLSTEEDLRKAADLVLKAHDDDLKVTEAQNAAADARYATETKILDLIKQQSIAGQLSTQISGALTGIPQELGDAIAEGLKGGVKHHTIGQDIGDDIVKAMKGTLQHTLGDIFTAAIKEGLKASGIEGLIFGHAATPTSAATGGLLGKLAQALHLPGSGTSANVPVQPPPGPGFPTSPQTVAPPPNPQITQLDTAINQIEGTLHQSYQELQTMETTLQQILAAIKTQTRNNAIASIAGGVVSGLIGLGGGGGGGEPQAEGGYDAPDVTHLVGEKGPELFTPSSAGTITPNSALGGGGGINGDVHIHVNGAQDPRSTAREVADEMKRISPKFQTASIPYSN